MTTSPLRDPYRPSREGHAFVGGQLLEQGYFMVETGRLEWEPGARVPCAYRVKGLRMVVAHSSSPER